MKSPFILQDNRRLALFNDLAKGKQSINTLVRKNRMLRNTVLSALDAMEDEGLVIRVGENYKLTVKGKALMMNVRKVERMGVTGKGVGISLGKRRALNTIYQKEAIL